MEIKKKRFNSNIKKQEVLSFIDKYIKKNKYSPSYEEIAIELNVTQSYVFNLSKKLIKEGHLTKDKSLNIRNLNIK